MAASLVVLLIQILVILVSTRICGIIAKRLGQPTVMGEIVAGILLGKSVLAQVSPWAFKGLFPEESTSFLYLLSQVGLIFFMFVVGLEFNVEALKKRIPTTLVVSSAGIFIPLCFGFLMARLWYEDFAPQGVSLNSFSLFVGVSMSVTAFPVLAKILREEGLFQTSLGTQAIGCAAVSDVIAWFLLAFIVAVVKAHSPSAELLAMGLAILYIFAMLKIVKPILSKRLDVKLLDGSFSQGQLATILLVVLGSALVTETIGIHAVFGAFFAGTIIPRSESLRHNLVARVEDFTSTVFLPIFFTYSGLRTEFGVLNSWPSWVLCFSILIIAVTGKLGATMVAARATGSNWRDAVSLGFLMNTRGLMELVVLNVGYDLGVISPTIFTSMIIMAVLTTAMTGPYLRFFLKTSTADERITNLA